MVTVVLLLGMDGTGELFGAFAGALGDDLPARIVSYPKDRLLSCAELAEFGRNFLPTEGYVLLGESFLGPDYDSL